jgi:hypothetical protein
VNKGRLLFEKRQALLARINEQKLIKYQKKKSTMTHSQKDKYQRLKKEYGVSDEIWVFFDEFNTSILQDYLGEIMIDRKSSLLPYHSKVSQSFESVDC